MPSVKLSYYTKPIVEVIAMSDNIIQLNEDLIKNNLKDLVRSNVERYKRRECSVEEALIEMYLAGVSVRRDEGHH